MREYSVIFSKRRTLAIEVKSDGSVKVRAPIGLKMTRIEEFVISHSEWIEKTVKKQKQRKELTKDLTEQEIKKYKEMAKKVIGEKVEYYSKLMGVSPTAVRITGAKTRFGSCSAKNSLSFSCRVMLYPEQAIDYVVVHELAHIKHHDHSKSFYAFIESVMPDYKMRDKILRNR